jgi:RND family efflux transporter MFP subunit
LPEERQSVAPPIGDRRNIVITSRRKTSIVRGGIVLASTALVVAVLFLAAGARGQGMGGPQPVVVDRVRLEKTLERRLVTGEIRALRRSMVAVREPGLVMAIAVREGKRVKKGALLAQLDSSRLELELRVIEARGTFDQATLVERKTSREQAARDLESIRQLDERGATNPKELADARTDLAAAEARIAQAAATIQENAAQAALLRRRIADMRIIAPFDGVVVTRRKEVGEWVGPGEAVLELITIGTVEAWFTVPQAVFDGVRSSRAPVIVSVPSAGVKVEATAIRVVPRVNDRARTFPLVVTLDNREGKLAAGMSATAWVPAGREADYLTVLRDALLFGDVGSYLYVARGGGDGKPAMAMPVPVNTLFPIGSRMAVEAPGLEPGALAIVEGNERLFPMTPVMPTPAGESPGGAGDPERGKGNAEPPDGAGK